MVKLFITSISLPIFSLIVFEFSLGLLFESLDVDCDFNKGKSYKGDVNWVISIYDKSVLDLLTSLRIVGSLSPRIIIFNY